MVWYEFNHKVHRENYTKSTKKLPENCLNQNLQDFSVSESQNLTTENTKRNYTKSTKKYKGVWTITLCGLCENLYALCGKKIVRRNPQKQEKELPGKKYLPLTASIISGEILRAAHDRVKEQRANETYRLTKNNNTVYQTNLFD